MSFNLPADTIIAVRSVTVTLDPTPHPFIAGKEQAIADNWAEANGANPSLFDGEVALLSSLQLKGEELAGRCHIVRYSTFLYWRKLRPVDGVGHAYAHALLVSSDNALILIRMASSTINAGLVYCAAGSFEPSDFRDGTVDIEANMRREVMEETGIDIAHAPCEPGYHLLSKTTGTVLFRRYFFTETAEELAAAIRAHVAAQDDSEIEGPVIVHGATDMPDRLAAQMPGLIDWHFSTPRES